MIVSQKYTFQKNKTVLDCVIQSERKCGRILFCHIYFEPVSFNLFQGILLFRRHITRIFHLGMSLGERRTERRKHIGNIVLLHHSLSEFCEMFRPNKISLWIHTFLVSVVLVVWLWEQIYTLPLSVIKSVVNKSVVISNQCSFEACELVLASKELCTKLTDQQNCENCKQLSISENLSKICESIHDASTVGFPLRCKF